jgi:hypothetical protein
MNSTETDYEPFGPEWIKEVMKLPKKFIITDLYKPLCIKLQSLDDTKDKLETLKWRIDLCDIQGSEGDAVDAVKETIEVINSILKDL